MMTYINADGRLVSKEEDDAERYAEQLNKRVVALCAEGVIKRYDMIAPNCYAVRVWGAGWTAAAKEFISDMPGLVRVISGQGGMTWQMSRKVVGYLVPRARVEGLQEAQQIVAPYDEAALETWNYGALGRLMLRYYGDTDKQGSGRDKQTESLLSGIQYGYMEVRPGAYDHATHFDCKSYYYSMMCRMPHLHCCIHDGEVQWQYVPPDQRKRYQEILEAVQRSKILRNSLAGACAGSYKWGVTYSKNIKKRCVPYAPALIHSKVQMNETEPYGGLFRTAGLLIVRTGWEITRKEVDNDATVYSRTDSLISTGEGTGEWERRGFRVTTPFSGAAHIVSLGCWRVGEKMTLPYQDWREQSCVPSENLYPGQLSDPTPLPRLPIPKHSYSNWL